MKNIVKRTIALILLFALTSVIPVDAQTLVGNENAQASGQTAVTACVKMETDAEEDSNIKTGDDSMTGTYVSLLLISMVVIVANGIRVCRQEE